jgi:hypothetical protein
MFVIVVTGLDGTQTKLASVERNPGPIAKAARLKRIRTGTRTIRQYINVEISEVKRGAADAISEADDEH